MSAYSHSGIPKAPHLHWGSHVSQFFQTGAELRDLMVPYFKAGLENNERCLWVTASAFTADQARAALRAAVPDLDARERARQIEIANAGEWYGAGDKLRPRELVQGLIKREQDALADGHQGLRTSGNCAWVSEGQWADFLEYETLVHQAVRGRRMICLCSFCMDQLADGGYLDVMERHDLVLPSRSPLPQASAAKERRGALEQKQRNFDVAMVASRMGTWRYTLADNICVYDENAQALYGLSEARFLHDEEGVKAKFHPDDMDLMWSRVAKALDPQGDGRYEVEYRVKQPDGSWRWLSAWGLVEFEQNGAGRKPVAITGASRDLSDRKEAEAMQRLLVNELNHRVKNTLATVQAITAQTLRAARDLPSAHEALDRRLVAMAHAHDILTARSWAGADLGEIVRRALHAFPPARVDLSGDAVDLPPKHALALSLTLHELATNAIKYGSLSCGQGRVRVRWERQGDMLQLEWEESGGPEVAEPAQKGFGSRLLQLLARDLDGSAKLDFHVSGVCCRISARLPAEIPMEGDAGPALTAAGEVDDFEPAALVI